jgi:hypothetical protein
MQHRIETKVEQEGVIVLHDLPFHKGETVEIVITTHRPKAPAQLNYPLRGKPVKLINPFDAVAEEDWSALA